jgi:hypothetical protein
MRVVGPLSWLAALAAAFAPNAWANPSNTDSSDVWVGTIVAGVVVGFFLVLLANRKRSRWSSSIRPARLAVACLGLILVVLGLYGFFLARPKPLPPEPVVATHDAGNRMGPRPREGVEWSWSGAMVAGLGLLAFGAWPRRAAAPRRHARIVPPPHAPAGHEIEESSPERGAAAP